MRANATLVLGEAFPVHDPDHNNATVEEDVQKQLDTAMVRIFLTIAATFIEFDGLQPLTSHHCQCLLEDPHPVVRSNAILAVCKILRKCWELLPPTVITDFLKKLMMELANDISSPDVRCAVFKVKKTFVVLNIIKENVFSNLAQTCTFQMESKRWWCAPKGLRCQTLRVIILTEES